MPYPPNIEAPPWKIEIRRYPGGFVAGVHVIASQPRKVYCATVGPFATNRAGRQVPTAETTSHTSESVQPAVVANCGVPYAGLSAETLLAHGDLIAAAPDLYAALEEALRCAELFGNTASWATQARDALAKAQGQEPKDGTQGGQS